MFALPHQAFSKNRIHSKDVLQFAIGAAEGAAEAQRQQQAQQQYYYQQQQQRAQQEYQRQQREYESRVRQQRYQDAQRRLTQQREWQTKQRQQELAQQQAATLAKQKRESEELAAKQAEAKRVQREADERLERESRHLAADSKDQYFRRYFHGLSMLFGKHEWLVWIAGGLLLAYTAIAGVGREKIPKTILVGSLILIPTIWWATIQGRAYAGYSESLRQGQEVYCSAMYKYANWGYIPLFISSHALLAWLLPAFCRGGHYLLVRHPAERYIGSIGYDGLPEAIDAPAVADAMPNVNVKQPAWKHENQVKRLRAAQTRVAEQISLMDSIAEHSKKRARFD